MCHVFVQPSIHISVPNHLDSGYSCVDQIITTYVPMLQNWVPKIVCGLGPGAQWCNIRAEESHRWSPASSAHQCKKQTSCGMLQLGVTPAKHNLSFSEIQQRVA